MSLEAHLSFKRCEQLSPPSNSPKCSNDLTKISTKMKSPSRLFVSFGVTILILIRVVSCKEKLFPPGERIEAARRISRCTVEAATSLFTSSNDVAVVITPDPFDHPDVLQDILTRTLADRPGRTCTNLRSNRSSLSSKKSSFLLIVNHTDLRRLLTHRSVDRWAEYVILLTKASAAWLAEFANHLWNLGFVKVAFVRVTPDETTSVLRMTRDPSSRGSQPTLKTLDACNETSSVAKDSQHPSNVTQELRPFSSWLYLPTSTTLRFARMLQGVEKSGDFGIMENGSLTSFGGDVINIFTEKRNLRLARVSWNDESKSNWEDGMRRCMTGELDVFYTVLPPPRNTHADLVEPIAWYKFEALVFLYHPKKSLVSLTNLLLPYSNIIWICTIFLFVAFVIFALFVDALSYRGLILRRITPFDISAIFLWQPVAFVPAKLGLRIVLGMWLLFSLNNGLLYTGRFSSSLTATGTNHYLRNFHDILQFGKKACGDDKSEEFLKNSDDPLLLQLHDRFEVIPTADVLRKVVEEDYVGTRHVSYIERFNWMNRVNDSRRLYIVEGAVVITYPALYFAKKHHPYSQEFNRIITTAHQAGLVMKAHDKYTIKLGKTREEMALSTSGDQVLHLTHLRVAFEILGIGYLVSGLVFLVEIYHHSRTSKKRANHRTS